MRTGFSAVMRLAQERPDLIPAVKLSLKWADAAEPYGGEFAGAWVVQELGRWLPGLRTLRAAGIIEKSGDSTRGGNRSYYRMPDRDGVRQALMDLERLGGGKDVPGGDAIDG
jgi:hypothetical protein